MRGAGRLRVIVGLFAVVLVLAACSGGDGGGGSTGASDGGGGTTGGGGGSAITIQGFAFNPSTLTVSGQTTLTVTNKDDVTHTFTLDDGSVDQEVPAGQSITVTVEISKTTGFHCKIHSSMTGTLEVA